MKSSSIIYSLTVCFFCLFISLDSHSFPKKKHSIVKDKIDKSKYEELLVEYGYYWGFLEWCSFRQTDKKETYKRIKGAVAYTNWDLFLLFNKGTLDVSAALRKSGIGWAGGSQYIGVFNDHQKVFWDYDLVGCQDFRSLEKSYTNMNYLIQNILIDFLLSRDNYENNFTSLISALKTDKKDDYSGVVNLFETASSDTTSNAESNNDSSYKETSADNNSDDSSDDIKLHLKKLKSFFEEDLITEDEYKDKKQELLDKL